MCGMCPDTIGGCASIECGAREPVDPLTGERRRRYMRWFSVDEIPCAHVAAEHRAGCATPVGGFCTCDDDDEASGGLA
jgi:hypothetical protein